MATLAKWFLAFLLSLIILNLLSALIFPVLPERENDMAAYLLTDSKIMNPTVYEPQPDGYANQVVADFIRYMGKTRISYFPHSEYCESPFRSSTLNILTDPTGITYRAGAIPCFTHIDTSIKRIYTFGGSTTLGFFVADTNTWPSQLNTILLQQDSSLQVINYGVTGHSITEEYFRLYDLLKTGHRPSMVIVCDGLNLGRDVNCSMFSKDFFSRIRHHQQGSESVSELLHKLLFKMPIYQTMLQLLPTRFLFQRLVSSDDNDSASSLENESKPETVHYISNRFTSGITDFKELCGKYNIPFYYILQPNTFYNYTMMGKPSAHWDKHGPQYHADVDTIYTRIKKNYPQVMDLTDLFVKFGKKCIVDDSHYSPEFNAFIASEIASHINIQAAPYAYFDTASVAGAPFPFWTVTNN